MIYLKKVIKKKCKLIDSLEQALDCQQNQLQVVMKKLNTEENNSDDDNDEDDNDDKHDHDNDGKDSSSDNK